MKHRVSELEGALLDAAVAKAEGWILHPLLGDWRLPPTPDDEVGEFQAEVDFWKPSTAWDHGGPIIERELISVRWGSANAAEGWFATLPEQSDDFQDNTGGTPLIAAMRAYVASKLGDEVELP